MRNPLRLLAALLLLAVAVSTAGASRAGACVHPTDGAENARAAAEHGGHAAPPPGPLHECPMTLGSPVACCAVPLPAASSMPGSPASEQRTDAAEPLAVHDSILVRGWFHPPRT